MIEIQGKQYRNIQEQVQKNKEDIEWLFDHCGGSYVGGLNITVDGNVIKTASDPTFSNITIDNGTSGLYVNSLGYAGITYQSGDDRWSEVRIIEGTPEMISRSADYQASLLVGTQDIEIERKDYINDTTERVSLFDKKTKLYKHTLSGIEADIANSYYNIPTVVISTSPTPFTPDNCSGIISRSTLAIYGANYYGDYGVVNFPVMDNFYSFMEDNRMKVMIQCLLYGTFSYTGFFIENMTDTVEEL